MKLPILGIKLNPFHWFFIKAILLYLVWLGVYYQWGAKEGGIDDKMTEITAYSTLLAFDLTGYDTDGDWRFINKEKGSYTPLLQEHKGFFMSIDGQPTVSIGNRCNGLFIIALYIGFIISYIGRWKDKILFIILGSLLIFLSNIIRIMALSFNAIYSPDTLDFNHKYTYTFVVYSIVFLLWMLWVNRYAYKGLKPDIR